jgi:hypothetical protein
MISSEYIAWEFRGLWKSDEGLELRETRRVNYCTFHSDSGISGDGQSRSSEPTVVHSVSEVLRV